jgi:predicted MFS family arabinose efflux permease
MPLGSLLGGYLLDYFGARPTAIVLAVLMLVIAIGATLSPAIRKAGRTPLAGGG